RLLIVKFAFIDGELYQTIFGLGGFGAHLARSVDDPFFDGLKSDKIVNTDNIEETGQNFIKNTENRSNVVIFANWRNAEKLEDITYEHNNVKSIFNKKFEGVPVVHQFSKYKDSIIVIDFS